MDEQTVNTYAASDRVRASRRPAALAAAGAAGLLLVGAAGFVLGATPSSADPSSGVAASTAPGSSAAASSAPDQGEQAGKPGANGRGLGPWAKGALRGLLGPGRAFGAIHVTGVDGSNVSLATDDGWTRTITVGQDTTITRAGQTITVADLKAGDEVRLAETRQSDGSYAINRLVVVLPTVVGQVTAKTTDSITIKRPDGTTETVHVSGSTTYRTRGTQNASLADVAVGSGIIAQGTARSDGSIDALQVASGMFPTVEGGRGFGRIFGPRGPQDQNGRGGQNAATPAPSASGSTNG